MDLCRLFLRAHDGFAQRGLLGRALRLTQAERTYSVRCDGDCFTVYRVNDKPFLPPGLPGWTVCRLSRDECFSQPGQDAACLLPPEGDHMEAASQWVDMVLDLLTQASISTDEEVK